MSEQKGWGHRARRGGKPGEKVYVIDFSFIDAAGVRRRYREHAQIQSASGAAAEAKRRMKLAIETGSPDGAEPEAKKTSPTFKELWDDYVRDVYLVLIAATPATIERYLSLWKQFEPVFGSMRVDEFTTAAWERFEVSLAKRERVVKGKFKKGVQSRPFINFWFGTVLAAAVRAGHLVEVPKYKRPPKADTLPDCPTIDDVRAWLSMPVTWIVVLVAVSAYTGMRLSEVRARTRGDVDLEAKRIWIRTALSAEQTSTTKGKRERWIPLHEDLEAILRPWIRNKLPTAPLIVNGKGKIPKRQAAYAAMQRLCKMAGTKPWSVHSVRHYFTSELIDAGVPVPHVQQAVGHKNLSTTQRYVHVRQTALEAAISKLPHR